MTMESSSPDFMEWPEGLSEQGPMGASAWTPSYLKKLYDTGLRGSYANLEDQASFNAWARYRDYGEVCDTYDIWTSGPVAATSEIEPGLYLPFLAVVVCEAKKLGITGTLAELSRDERINPWDERQTTGDCVSHGTRGQCDVLRACDIIFANEPEQWIVRTATEPIYGHRGHGGQGADPGRLRRWVVESGGMMLRQKYEIAEYGELDLSRYNSEIGIRWGRTGVPQSVTVEAHKHPIQDVTRCTQMDQARQAFRNGLLLGGGSGLGISSRRDEHGVSRAEGSWAHDMMTPGYDERQSIIDIYGEPLVLEQNSWGAWNQGPRKIYGTDIWIPIGSCWLRESEWDRRKLRGGGVYVMAGAHGWEQTKLLDYGTNWLNTWGW